MARRHQHSRHAGGPRGGPGAPQREIERLIEKGRVKDAFKEAKLCFRQEATPENRQLVERTYLLRIQALISGGMSESAREVAGNLLEFGVTNPEILQSLVLLLPRVGMADKAVALQGAVTSPEAQASLAVNLADRAVLHPEETPASMPELRQEADIVRSALAALEAGSDARALELLQSIPRSSHLADWRYFVRGLASFRRSDMEQARANWERLDAQRSAQKIAQKLLSIANPDAKENQHNHLAALEASAFGEPLLERLNQLRQAMEAADWARVRRLVGPLQLSLRRVDPRWSQRLTEIVLTPLAAEIGREPYAAALRMIREFTAVLEPLPWDPNWNRFQALLWEGEQGDIHEALEFWQKYVKDLEQCSPIPGVESRQLQALVWRRIGEMSADLADDDESDDPEFFDDEYYDDDDYEDVDSSGFSPADGDSATQGLSGQAVAALEKSLLLDPTQRKTHELLIELFESDEQPERMAAALRKLLEVFPDDIETMQRLIAYHQHRDEPEPVLLYVERIRVLKPLDTRILAEEVWARLARARHLALQSRFQEGRDEFAHVATMASQFMMAFRLLARQAALEFKAGQADRAEAFIAQGTEALDEPTPFLLSMAIEAGRYNLNKTLRQRFNKQFETAAVRKVNSATAGLLAESMTGYVAGKIEYAGSAGHLRGVVGYLRRTTRIKYNEADLVKVCMFLGSLENEQALLEKLSNRGLKLFPKSPFFLHTAAVHDLQKGPMACNPNRSQKQLEQALVFAQASQNPLDATYIPRIKSALSRLKDIREAMSSLPFASRHRPRMPGAMQVMLDAFLDQFEPGGPDVDDDSTTGGRSRRRR